MSPKLAPYAALMAAIVPGGATAAPARHATVSQNRTRFGAWQMTIVRDDFVGAKICRLTARHLAFERDTLIVRLPAHIDTMNAVYRIDGGQPFLAASDDALMAQRGFALRADNLANPSGGVVRIPQERVIDAKQVRIETAIGRIWTFELTGLQTGLDALKTAGCA